ncbi:hypothetical protein [Variovorax sp. DAIF25]|uniref:hypothetical protein n=1 Tax=Variovorax sp. DAIF25 TaxID=3080983 RepID=UPI003D6C6F66
MTRALRLLACGFLISGSACDANESLARYVTGCDFSMEVPVKSKNCSANTVRSVHDISVDDQFVQLKYTLEESGCLEQKTENFTRIPRRGVTLATDDHAYATTKTIAFRCEEGVACVQNVVSTEKGQRREKLFGFTFGACNAVVQEKMRRLLGDLIKQ